MSALAACGSGRAKDDNISRNFHRLLGLRGKLLPIEVNAVNTPVFLFKGKPKIETTMFPVLLPSSWMDYIMSIGGEAVLGGWSLGETGQFEGMLEDFWEKYAAIKPDFSLAEGLEAKRCIPVALHGDEGRGKAKRPIMVLAWQPLLSWKGPELVNMGGSSMTTRLLYTVIPSETYAGEQTLQTLLGALADDLNQLYSGGLEAGSQKGWLGVYLGRPGYVPIYIAPTMPFLEGQHTWLCWKASSGALGSQR